MHFASTIEDPDVVSPGMYELTVTTVEGCFNTININVEIDTATIQINLNADTITCTSDSADVVLAYSETPNAIAWTGPNGFGEVLPNFNTTTPGII